MGMASSVEATRAQLEAIGIQLFALKNHATTHHAEPAIRLLNAALNDIASFDEDVPLPVQNVLGALTSLKGIMPEESSQTLITAIRQECISLLIAMFSKNQQKIDSISEGPQKLKAQYHSDFLERKAHLVQNYHQDKKSPKVVRYFSQVFQFLDFLKPLRKAEFLNALHAQTIKYYRQTQVADTSFNHAHLSEVMQLEIMQRVIHQTLTSEPTFNIGMLPQTSRSYQFFLKELVGRYHGIVIGNLSVGENSFEVSREWLMQINKLMKQPLQTYQLISEMDKFTTSEQHRFERIRPKVSTQSLQDKSVTPEEFKKLKSYDEKFISDLLSLLDTSYPQSTIVQFSDNKGASHSIAIAKDERGIWLHDPKQYCVYFPNKVLGSNDATMHFEMFFHDYHHRNYQNLTQVGLVHLPEQRPQVEKEQSQHHRKGSSEREQPLLIGPGRGLSKQPFFELETAEPKPTYKPANDGSGSGPKSSR